MLSMIEKVRWRLSVSWLRRREALADVRKSLCGAGTRCTECGYRVRSPNHEQGSHHWKKRAARRG